jgi:CheY-like chemotaxis protein
LERVASLADARGRLGERRFDCVIVEQSAEGDGADEGDLAAAVAAQRPPVAWLCFGGQADRPRLNGGAKAFDGWEAVVDAALAACHRGFETLPPPLRALVRDARAREDVLAGRQVVVVDDDIRNIFALASVLETRDMKVLPAESGQAALELLDAHPDVDIVLMDIMMPGMDGFDAIREIRRRPSLRSLPIIAVTARAMKGDREKTLLAGAWDYLAKPVDPERMLAVLETWLQR